jgi:hypothetical protein
VQLKAAVDDDYAPSGSGRVPGSKYTITEVEINDCMSQPEIEGLVAKHAVQGRKNCCGRVTGVLADWEYVECARRAASLPPPSLAHQALDICFCCCFAGHRRMPSRSSKLRRVSTSRKVASRRRRVE